MREYGQVPDGVGVLGSTVRRLQRSQIDFEGGVECFVRAWVLVALVDAGGNQCAAASAMGLHRNTFKRMAMRLGVPVGRAK